MLVTSSFASKGQDDGRPTIEFYGIVQKLPASGLLGDWLVGGRTLHVTNSSEVRQDQGPARLGACAQVKGIQLMDGSVEGARVDVRASASDCGDTGFFRDDVVEIRGVVQSAPSGTLLGDWMVSGRMVKVSAATVVKQEAARAVPGVCVEVKGQSLAAGAVSASTIETKPADTCSIGATERSEAYGLIRRMPPAGVIGEWQIGDVLYRVSSAAAVDARNGAPMLGACVEVKGVRQPDGAILVERLEVKSASGSCFSPRSVLNAASYQSGRVSPGEIVTIFGFSIGPSVPASFTIGDDKRVSTSAGGVRVLFDDAPAPVLLGSMNQVNVIVPYTVAGKSEVKIEVEVHGSKSNSVIVPVAQANPGLFTDDASGRGHAIAFNEDGSRNSSANPARRGSVVFVYAAGCGLANRRLDDGAIVADASALAAAKVSMLVAGREAEVLYAGAAPGLVAALAQINFRLPDDAPSGSDVPVQLRIAGMGSPDGVTISVR